MKKLTAFICACVMVFSVIPAQSAEITGNTASVEFNRPPQYKNIKSAVMGDASTIYCVERADKYGWTLDVNKGDNARYIYIDFEDEFLSEINDGTAVDIEVEYFDADNAMFTLSYDAQEDASRDAEIIYLGISNTWKTHTFSLNDAYFGGRLNGHDLRIGIHSDDMGKAKQSVIISKVTVTKYQAKNPVSIKTTSEETGNIFGNGEKIKFKNTYKSFRDEDTELLAEYRAVKKNGDVVWSKNDTITVKARETLEVTIELEITEYELYYLETVIQNDSLNINTENKVPFSFVNTDPNGIKNERFGTNVHHLFGRDPYKENKAILKANISSIREGVYWEHFEDLQGVYSFEGDVEERIFDAARKAGLKVLINTQYGNYLYGLQKEAPKTDAQLQAHYNYVYNLVKQTCDVAIGYEFWNEPNLSNFNPKGDTPEQFTKALEYFYKAVKDADPNAHVSAFGLAGAIWRKEGYAWFEKTMAAGAAPYMDSIAVHPYGLGVSAENHGTANILTDYAKVLKENGNENPIINNSEYGFTITDVGTEKKQADYIVRSYVYLTSNNVNDMFFLYEFSDSGNWETNREHNFGIVNRSLMYNPVSNRESRSGVNSSAKEAYAAVTQLNYMMADSKPDRRVDGGEGDYIYLYDSNKFNKKFGVLWNVNGTKEISLKINTDVLEHYDRYGNKTVINGNDGIFTVVIGESPIYLMGNFSQCEIVDSGLVSVDDVEVDAIIGDQIKINYHNALDKTLKTEIVCPNNMKLVSNTEAVTGDGFAVVELDGSEDIIGESAKLYIKFKDADKVVAYIPVNVTYSPKINSSITNSLYDGKNMKRWVGEVIVENYSKSKDISARIVFNYPEEFKKIGAIKTGAIAKDKVVKVKFNLPEFEKLGMYYLDYDVILDDGSVYNFSQSLDFTVAAYAKTKPVIDGTMRAGEWAANTAMFSENAEQIKLITDYGGITDLSARTNIMWDEDYMYMGVRVRDDIFSNTYTADQIWNGDSVQFGIVYVPEAEFVAYGDAHVAYSELGMAKTPEGNIAWRWLSEDDSHALGEIEEYELEITRDGVYTIYELKLPWKEVLPQGATISEDRPLGFSLLVNDNDGSGRRGWIEYASGIGLSKDSTLFTYLKLIK